MRCKTGDKKIKVDGKTYRLKDISRVERRREDEIVVVLKDGRQLKGKKLSVGSIKADFGQVTATIDGDSANSIVVYDRDIGGQEQDRPNPTKNIESEIHLSISQCFHSDVTNKSTARTDHAAPPS